jgi:hypothetical protein
LQNKKLTSKSPKGAKQHSIGQRPMTTRNPTSHLPLTLCKMNNYDNDITRAYPYVQVEGENLFIRNPNTTAKPKGERRDDKTFKQF